MARDHASETVAVDASPGIQVHVDSAPSTASAVVGASFPSRERWGDMLPWDNWKGFLSGSIRAFLVALVVNVALQCLGGAIFYGLEHQHEKARIPRIIGIRWVVLIFSLDLQVAAERYQELRTLLDAELNNITEVTGKRYNTTARALVDNIFQHLTSEGLCSIPHPDHLHWTFIGSSFFSLTLFTTVGYGTFTPHTSGGKAFTCIYGIAGIAVFAWYLTVVIPLIKKVEQRIVNFTAGGKLTDHHKRLFLNIVVCMVVVMFGAVVAHSNLDVSYGDGVYFSLVTLTTIGLGDIAPDVRNMSFVKYVGYTLWIYFGIAFMSYIITIVADIVLESLGMDVYVEMARAESAGVEIEITQNTAAVSHVHQKTRTAEEAGVDTGTAEVAAEAVV